MLLATAHNEMGDFHLRQGGHHLQRALDHYSRALVAARATRPPNTYYECAALVNICRAHIRAGLPAAELVTRRDGPLRSEEIGDVQTLIAEARMLGQTHRYRQHLARLAVLEAEWALKRGDQPSAQRAAGAAIHLAHNFSPHLLNEVSVDLNRLALPHGLAGVLLADADLS